MDVLHIIFVIVVALCIMYFADRLPAPFGYWTRIIVAILMILWLLSLVLGTSFLHMHV